MKREIDLSALREGLLLKAKNFVKELSNLPKDKRGRAEEQKKCRDFHLGT